MKELTDKQAKVFDNLHEQLAEYRKMHTRLKKLKSKYSSVCKETIIMDDEDGATVSTYKRVVKDLSASGI
jgi:hypothetical protein